jgi:hypothetical protein
LRNDVRGTAALLLDASPAFRTTAGAPAASRRVRRPACLHRPRQARPDLRLGSASSNVHGVDRLQARRHGRVASAHFAVSVLPGAILWALLALVDLSARPSHPTTALTPSALVAFAYVSTVAWATTLWGRRYTGGGLWLVGIVVLAATHDLEALRLLFQGAHESWADALSAAGAALLCPIIVADAAAADPVIVGVVLAVAVLFLCAGLLVIEHTDVPLVDGFR